jgi:hypothetical protein
VVKKGRRVGRGVELGRLGGYGELMAELERMFNLEPGQLMRVDRVAVDRVSVDRAVDLGPVDRTVDRGPDLAVAYSDADGDMLLVGDDPWL